MATKKGNKTPATSKAGKITLKGYKAPAFSLLAFVTGLVAFSGIQYLWHKARPASMTPGTTSGWSDNLKLYWEPVALIVLGLTGYQVVKDSFWKTFFLGGAGIGGLQVADLTISKFITDKPILNQLYGLGEMPYKQLNPTETAMKIEWNNQQEQDNNQKKLDDYMANANSSLSKIA